MKIPHHTLSNGIKMPALGFGTWKSQEGKEAENSVFMAIETGYRCIDCASIYKNQKSVGEALSKSDVKRSDLFITSKLWNDDKGYESTLRAFEKTLEELKLDYLDLYLIHWPIAKKTADNWQQANLDTWRAMEELYDSGKIKAIGVSNFKPHHLETLIQEARILPMVNQVELHVGMPQEETLHYCREHKIQVEAWAPLAKGEMMDLPVLKEMSHRYGKTVAQLCLRWIVQHKAIPLPKSVTAERIEENFDIFDFELSHQDMEFMDGLPNYGGSGMDPDTARF